MKTAVECTKFLISNGLDKTLPHFPKAAKILATKPATSCSAERSFSGLQQLKTYLRSTMDQTRLSNLALLYLERQTSNKLDVKCIIDIFGQRHGRNILFLN